MTSKTVTANASNSWLAWLLYPPENGPAAYIFVRLVIGGTYVTEGILKFVYPSLGVKRFTLLGFPSPDLIATFTGSLEIIGGLLLLVGFLTRPLALIFLGQLVIIVLTTKIPLLLGTSPLPPPPVPPQSGLGALLHEGRADYTDIMLSLFLLVLGSGSYSVDAWLSRRHREQQLGGNTGFISDAVRG